MYILHDNGRALFDSARECTPIQRFLYVMARNEHEEDPQSAEPPSDFDRASRVQSAGAKF